jgi:hypothetical protein
LKLTPATKIVDLGSSFAVMRSIVSSLVALLAAASTKRPVALRGAARRGAAARRLLPVKDDARRLLLQLARAPQRAPAALDVAIGGSFVPFSCAVPHL